MMAPEAIVAKKARQEAHKLISALILPKREDEIKSPIMAVHAGAAVEQKAPRLVMIIS